MKITNPNTNRAARCLQKGFTLVELLLVLTILAILAGIVLPKMAGRTEQARHTAALTQISAFGTALGAYEVDMGGYPATLAELWNAPRDAHNWHGPYMDKPVINDPWGKPWIYQCPGRHNPKGYDLSSGGPDGRSNDELSNWAKQ
ncbi:MAG: type II secretion system major pseudopilin GspG [Verrucomicrobiota bacterium]|jgi:general secretion pathway protein G